MEGRTVLPKHEHGRREQERHPEAEEGEPELDENEDRSPRKGPLDRRRNGLGREDGQAEGLEAKRLPSPFEEEGRDEENEHEGKKNRDPDGNDHAEEDGTRSIDVRPERGNQRNGRAVDCLDVKGIHRLLIEGRYQGAFRVFREIRRRFAIDFDLKAILSGALPSLENWDFSPARYNVASTLRIMFSFSELPYPAMICVILLFA